MLGDKQARRDVYIILCSIPSHLVNLLATEILSGYLSILLYKAEKPSVCLTVTPISQPYQHGLKRDLLEMEAESSGTTKFIFKSRYVRLLINSHECAEGTGVS